MGKIPSRSSGQYTPVFLPENILDRGAWQAVVHKIAELDTTKAIEHPHIYFAKF